MMRSLQRRHDPDARAVRVRAPRAGALRADFGRQSRLQHAAYALRNASTQRVPNICVFFNLYPVTIPNECS